MADDDGPQFPFEIPFGGGDGDMPEPLKRLFEQGTLMSESMEVAGREQRVQAALDMEHHDALTEVLRAEVAVAEAQIALVDAELADPDITGTARAVWAAKKVAAEKLRDALAAQVKRMDDLKEVKLRLAEISLKQDPGGIFGVFPMFGGDRGDEEEGPADGTVAGNAEDPRFDPAPQIRRKDGPQEKRGRHEPGSPGDSDQP